MGQSLAGLSSGNTPQEDFRQSEIGQQNADARTEQWIGQSDAIQQRRMDEASAPYREQQWIAQSDAIQAQRLADVSSQRRDEALAMAHFNAAAAKVYAAEDAQLKADALAAIPGQNARADAYGRQLAERQLDLAAAAKINGLTRYSASDRDADPNYRMVTASKDRIASYVPPSVAPVGTWREPDNIASTLLGIAGSDQLSLTDKFDWAAGNIKSSFKNFWLADNPVLVEGRDQAVSTLGSELDSTYKASQDRSNSLLSMFLNQQAAGGYADLTTAAQMAPTSNGGLALQLASALPVVAGAALEMRAGNAGSVVGTGLTTEFDAASASAAFQGQHPYYGIDQLQNTSYPVGSRLVQLTHTQDGVPVSSYFTTEEALNSAKLPDGTYDANVLNQGLQTYPGNRTNFRSFAQTYEVNTEIPFGGAATGPTRANPYFNPGQYPSLDQIFLLPEFKASLTPVRLDTLTNTAVPKYTPMSEIINNMLGLDTQ